MRMLDPGWSPAAGSASPGWPRLCHGCSRAGAWTCSLLRMLGDVLGTHWQCRRGSTTEPTQAAAPTPTHPKYPSKGVEKPLRWGWAGGSWRSRLSRGLSPAGTPSPAHGSQRDQVHRAGGGERPPAGKHRGGPGPVGGGGGGFGVAPSIPTRSLVVPPSSCSSASPWFSPATSPSPWSTWLTW